MVYLQVMQSNEKNTEKSYCTLSCLNLNATSFYREGMVVVVQNSLIILKL